MWLKKEKINILEKSMENLSNTLQKGNYEEWAYLLRKQKRNYQAKLVSWNKQGSRNRYRNYYYHRCVSHVVTKNRYPKYSCHWRIYC